MSEISVNLSQANSSRDGLRDLEYGLLMHDTGRPREKLTLEIKVLGCWHRISPFFLFVPFFSAMLLCIYFFLHDARFRGAYGGNYFQTYITLA